MFGEITCFEDIERDVEAILSEIRVSQNPVSSDRIVEIRMHINEGICAVLAFARDSHGRFSCQDTYTKFCEDAEIIGEALRQHQLRWTQDLISRSHEAYLESSKRMEQVVRMWVSDMKFQLSALPAVPVPMAQPQVACQDRPAA